MPYKDKERAREYAREYRKRHAEKQRAYHAEWFERNAERKRERDRQYYEANRAKIVAYALQYQRDHLPEITARTLYRYHNDPEFRTQFEARVKVNHAIKLGRIVKPTRCEHCGVDANPVAHHADYSAPLEVAWLCRPCHRAVHRLARSF